LLLREWQRAQEGGRLRASSSQSVKEYLDGWLANVRHSLKPRTLEAYGLCVRRITPRIGKVPLDQLRGAHVQQCYSDLLNPGLARRTVEQTHAVLHRALAQAVMLDLCTRNATEAAEVPRPERKEMKTLTGEELIQLFESSRDDRWYALWVLLGSTGLRRGEAMGLKWSDVDLEERRLVVRRSLQRIPGEGLQLVPPKTEAGRRTVALTEEACEALREHRRRQRVRRVSPGPQWRGEDLVFCSAFGARLDPSRINPELNKALAKAGLERVRVHDLRHTFATLMLKQREHPRVVQEMLGHSSIMLTLDTHSHVSESMQRDAADRLDEAFKSARRGAV